MNILRFNIRSAVAEDLNRILIVFKSSIEQSCFKEYSLQQIASWSSAVANVEKWKRKISDQYFLVAEIENRIVGFASAENDLLDLLYVIPEFQQSGIGGRLVSVIEDNFKRHLIISVFTDSSLTAKPFFIKQGYSVLNEQIVRLNGIDIPNFKMTKILR